MGQGRTTAAREQQLAGEPYSYPEYGPNALTSPDTNHHVVEGVAAAGKAPPNGGSDGQGTGSTPAAHLLAHVQQLYANVANGVRRNLNQTFFEKFYIDDLDVIDDELTPLFAEIHQAKHAFGGQSSPAT